MDQFHNIRAFISAASEYLKHPSETTASVVQRNLGAISNSTDPNLFDPCSSVLTMFYVSLHEIINSLDSGSSLIWTAVDVLQTTCKNRAARYALIHTYKFAPILTKLLEANLTSEKRIRALKLLQELTYGIKMSWQEAHLPYLITKLSQWVIQSSEEEVITLSLGVLVNLCYKNLPAVYVLMRTVNTKTFLQCVIKTRGQNVNIRVPCCKLLLILEHSNSDILDSYILDVAAFTFINIIPTLVDEDVLLLRHIVDFFDDIRQNDRFRTVLLTYPNYFKDVTNILETFKDISNQECASLIMEFLLSLLKLKVPDLVHLYSLIVNTAVTWISIEYVGSKALSLIKYIVIDSRRIRNNTKVIEKLDLSVLTHLIKDDDESCEKSTIVIKNNLSELMQLFQELIKTPARTKVLEIFSVLKMRFLMRSILTDNNEQDKPRNLFHDSSTDFYIHALALIADLATNNTLWLTLYTELLQRKQMQIIMAIALFTGDSDVKQKVLQLTSTVGFPQECISAVAKCMAELQPLVVIQEKINISKDSENLINIHLYDSLPLFSMAQENRLDTLISKLENAFEKNNLSNITTSAIMELYEYKMATMKHAERTMQASLEAASNNATSLQHRLAQLITQSSQLHQVLFNTQQCLEGTQIEKHSLMNKLKETEEKTKTTHSVQVQEIAGLKNIVFEKNNQINIYSTRIKDLENQNDKIPILINKTKDLEDNIDLLNSKLIETLNKNQEMSKLLQNMQENISRKEQIIEEKNREIAANDKDMAALNQEIKQQAQQCHSYEMTIAKKEEIVQKLSNELHNLSRMRDMIFELTAKKRDDL
ncbi:PREDICTED: protein CIP2A [Ceratosolen solmsi marchali]|uniref:Protein CIP2A n=1 Tax=Ceratosolen solmsi marchali TaxID=326594 RepID=A0AAJ6YK54_9HYME|nr:PREDICTED: protein CIP2A [Ceratosolen solmsi marchali]